MREQTHAEKVAMILATRNESHGFWSVYQRREAVLIAEVERLRRVEEPTRAVTADSLSPWGSSAYEDYWQCDYCRGRCDDMGDEPGDWGHSADCPWMALRRELHPDAVVTPD